MVSYLGKREDYVCLAFEKFRDSLVKFVDAKNDKVWKYKDSLINMNF